MKLRFANGRKKLSVKEEAEGLHPTNAAKEGLHVLKAGSGPRLVLMNGWPSTLAEYLPALPLLGDFEVWIVSRSGYGFSHHGLAGVERDDHALQVVADELVIDLVRHCFLMRR